MKELTKRFWGDFRQSALKPTLIADFIIALIITMDYRVKKGPDFQVPFLKIYGVVFFFGFLLLIFFFLIFWLMKVVYKADKDTNED